MILNIGYLVFLVGILAAILDFLVMCISDENLCSFIMLGIVKNLYLDTEIVTLVALLRKLELFSIWLGSHLGSHLGFQGNNVVIKMLHKKVKM